MARKSLDNILFAFGFIFAVAGYSLWKPIEDVLGVDNEGQVFYISIAVAFTFYTGAYLVAKYQTWKWFPYFAFSVCFSRVIHEINPELAQQYDWSEYLTMCMSGVVIAFYYIKYKWNKFYNIK